VTPPVSMTTPSVCQRGWHTRSLIAESTAALIDVALPYSVKGTCVTLLFPYLHWPARQGEVFASLFVKPPTTGAASAKSYDLYSRLGVLRILSRNYAYRRRVEVT
jgi:hypothetical protein